MYMQYNEAVLYLVDISTSYNDQKIINLYRQEHRLCVDYESGILVLRTAQWFAQETSYTCKLEPAPKF